MMMIASTQERLTSSLIVLFLVWSCLVCNSCLYGAVSYDSLLFIIMHSCVVHRLQVYGDELPAVVLLQPPAHLTVSRLILYRTNLINCTGDQVARNARDSCEKLKNCNLITVQNLC